MTHIPFERLHHFRDLGGYVTADGRTVRWGQVYRSDALSELRGADWDRFLTLGVRTVIDLRHSREIEAKGRMPEHASFGYHHLGLEHRPYDQVALGRYVNTAATGTAAARSLADRYLEVAEDGVKELRRALELIADADAGPVVLHRAAGEDRTGPLTALLLALVGVAEADIVEGSRAHRPRHGPPRRRSDAAVPRGPHRALRLPARVRVPSPRRRRRAGGGVAADPAHLDRRRRADLPARRGGGRRRPGPAA
ncbi:tyrosine-protein phosphatase [Streptomyces sp. PmtG]